MMRVVNEVEGAFSDADKAFLSAALRSGQSASSDNILMEMKIPKDSGRKTALARLLAQEFLSKDGVCLKIEDRDTWASSGNPFLFEAVLARFEGKGVLDEDSLLVFDADENLPLECVVALLLYFCWSFTLFIRGRDFILSVDDEEFLTITGDSLPEYWRETLQGF